MNDKDIKTEYLKGKGPGGQHKNKVANMVRLTHLPTGIVVTQDGRKRQQNIKKAYQELAKRLIDRKQGIVAADKKARRDEKIHNTETIRTYDYKKGTVKDHRSGKTASLKQVIGKGKIELLRE